MEIKLEDLKILYSEDQLQTRIREIAQDLNDFYKGEEVTAICVLKGAIMFAVELVKDLNMPVKMEFIRLSSYGSATSTSGTFVLKFLSLVEPKTVINLFPLKSLKLFA